MDHPKFRYPTSEKRKHFIRSSGSFSTIEDNIVAPTPRKIPSVGCSPKVARKEKIPGNKTFEEAGFEIQNILSQIYTPQPVRVQITHVLEEEIAQPKIVTMRTSNPITCNTPFHLEPRHSHHVNMASGRVARGITCSRKELNRARSLSWPGVPKGVVLPKTVEASS